MASPASPASPRDNRRLRRDSRKHKAGIRQFSLDEIISLSLLAHRTVVLHSTDDHPGGVTRCTDVVMQALKPQLSDPEEAIQIQVDGGGGDGGGAAKGRGGRRRLSSWL